MDDALKEIDQKDIDNLTELAKLQGVVYEQPLTKGYFLSMFEAEIKLLNKEVESGELKVLADGSLIEKSDSNFYLQGGSTYDKSYWWGKKRYKSTAKAKVWSRDLKSVAHANAAGAFLAGAVFGGVGSVPNGLTAVYLYNLADKVDYRNGLNNRGIIATVTYDLVFTTASQ
ncbi:hypothetical protein [Bacillus sp. mrc49]|uniref:hypothetical protein n=1 Tax=Bacillus sp. mrc49 TaxID=2054913 RepID=UPI000C27AE56|nr:hypothetical protein [Bacillus sp. mrc49]PJN91553.1 hypothetical protein CVN76_04280 [Bacillus sp. mrc49]